MKPSFSAQDIKDFARYTGDDFHVHDPDFMAEEERKLTGNAKRAMVHGMLTLAHAASLDEKMINESIVLWTRFDATISADEITRYDVVEENGLFDVKAYREGTDPKRARVFTFTPRSVYIPVSGIRLDQDIVKTWRVLRI